MSLLDRSRNVSLWFGRAQGKEKTTFYVRAVVTSLSTSYLCIAVWEFFLVFGILRTSFFLSRSCALRTIFCCRENTVLTLKKTAKIGKISCSMRVGCMESSKPNSESSVTKIVCHIGFSGIFYPQSTTLMPRHDDTLNYLYYKEIPFITDGYHTFFLTIEGVFPFWKILPAITSMFNFFWCEWVRFSFLVGDLSDTFVTL